MREISRYYINKSAQKSGEHEIHKEGCSFIPDSQNREYLGNYMNCSLAIKKAKEVGYKNVDGCYYCSKECHNK